MSNGSSNKGGGQAMAMVMKRAMATTMMASGGKEGNCNGGQP